VAEFEVVRHTSLTAPQAWERVTDWGRHGDFVPFTKVRVVTVDDEHEQMIARTGIGPIGFDDPMLVTYSVPPTETSPGIARLVKTGRVVLGWAVVTVTPQSTTENGRGGSVVRWREEARLHGTGGPVAAAIASIARLGFAHLIDGLLSTPPGSQRDGS
jgi:hypothetical protein